VSKAEEKQLRKELKKEALRRVPAGKAKPTQAKLDKILRKAHKGSDGNK
jgi:hypothetical protein